MFCVQFSTYLLPKLDGNATMRKVARNYTPDTYRQTLNLPPGYTKSDRTSVEIKNLELVATLAKLKQEAERSQAAQVE